jgi:hypothetical protein
VEADGTVRISAITSTISGNGDTGADPNRLVAGRDSLWNTDPGKAGRFHTLHTAGFGEALRGISFASRPSYSRD